MKKVKKYYPGVNGLITPNAGAVTDPNAFSTGKFLFPQQKTLGNIVDNKVMSQDYFDKTKPSFKDKAGAFMGNYGGAITQAAGTLMPLLMKKTDPNARPYKKGSKLIKYQEGNEYLQSGKGMKNFLNTMEENSTKLSNASVTKQPAEKFDMSSLNEVMPDIPRRSPKGSKAPNDTQVGPSRKEMADLMRAYNKKESAAGRLGYLDEDYLERKFVENQQMVGGKIEPNVKGKIETLSPRMASLKLASSSRLPEKLNTVPVPEKLSRRERKAENKRLEKMVKAPITYNENSFVGPPEFVGPSDQELKSGRIREDAESARKNYEARLAGESARSAYEAKQKNAPVFKRTMFKDMTPAQQKQYRAGIASGREFTIEGIGKYAAASKEQQAKSSRMAGKSGGAKPLVKMKEDSWTEAQWQKFLKDRNKSNTSGTQNVPKKENSSFNPYSGAGFTIPFNQPGKTTSTPKTEKGAQQRTQQKPAQKAMGDNFFERLTGVAKNLNTQTVKQSQKETLNKFRKSGKMQGLQESLEYMKNLAGGRYKAPEAPRADAGKRGVKTYWERVTSKQTERDPRAEYDYQKLAPWGKVKSEGAMDYLSTLFASPQKTTNYMLTGRYERPLDTYNLAKSKADRITGWPKLLGDIATDPMMYPEAFYGATKMAGQMAYKGAVKAGKAIGGALKRIPYAKVGQALEKFGGKVLSEKGRIGQALLHYNEDSKEREEREKNRPTYSMK